MADHRGMEAIEDENLRDRLCAILSEQVAWARRGDVSRVEQLGIEADAVIARMVQDRPNQTVIPECQRTRLKCWYDQLAFALQAEQADVQTKLKQLRQVKRAVGAYNRKKQS